MLRSFMIATTPRTGGNWLDRELGRAGIGRPDEYLRILSRDDALTRTSVPRLWQRYSVNEIFGIKVHWDEQTKWKLPINFGSLLPPGPKVHIHLVREDKEAQARSLATAEEFGTWFVRPAEEFEPQPRPASVVECLGRLVAMDRNWEQWWRRCRIQPLRVSYEQMITDIGQVINTIFDAVHGSSDV
jgi:LPS sulfotransferase NodH